jgi:D-tyrosyl-tRNA(Tyr) deacylase
VRVNGRVCGAIEQGLLVLVGVGRNDGPAEAAALAEKIAHLRIFDDAAGRMNRSLLEIGGAALVVSQFTLYGDVRRGRRPGFERAAPPEQARPLYEEFVARLRQQGLTVATGEFQARMDVELVNEGPVTILLDTEKTF